MAKWYDGKLSVSSYGSTPLQLLALMIEAAASSIFQYPPTDRHPCNVTVSLRAPAINDFQYPPTDRHPCNLQYCLGRCRASQAFSILLRIDTPATPLMHDANEMHTNFQYPPTDRHPCNRVTICQMPIGCILSVSSYGSTPLQRIGVLLRERTTIFLSVSSYGSTPLQRKR